MQIVNNLNLPQTVGVDTLAAGDGFALNGGVFVSRGAAGALVEAIDFATLAVIALSPSTQVYRCAVKVVADPLP